MADRFVHLKASPLAPGKSRIPIYVRDAGRGQPLVFLHGGWGYSIYPFDRQLDAFVCRHRIVIPDRTGYGRSGPLDRQRPDFHQRAADETFAVLDALGVERAVLWGHSDGAVIALRMALSVPARAAAVVAEACHFYRRKPRSRMFFETMRDRPDDLGARAVAVLQQEHGNRWRALISTNGAAWLQIADEALSDTADLYDGRLPELNAPVPDPPWRERPSHRARRGRGVHPRAVQRTASRRQNSRTGRSQPAPRTSDGRCGHRLGPGISDMSAFAFEAVSRDFVSPDGRSYCAVNDVSLDIPAGSFVALVGPSGCGKSTLLNLAAGLLQPTRGRVNVDGTLLTGLNRRATYMFQQDALLPWKNVRDNVALGLTLGGVSRPAAHARADRWLARVGLSSFALHYPSQLSGGMRKRVSMAQNWIIDRSIILMDEPFSSLDVHTRQRMESELLALWDEAHEQNRAVRHTRSRRGNRPRRPRHRPLRRARQPRRCRTSRHARKAARSPGTAHDGRVHRAVQKLVVGAARRSPEKSGPGGRAWLAVRGCRGRIQPDDDRHLTDRAARRCPRRLAGGRGVEAARSVLLQSAERHPGRIRSGERAGCCGGISR